MVDKATGRGVAGAVGVVTDRLTGAPVDVLDSQGNPKRLLTNHDGYFEEFRTSDQHDVIEMTFGRVSLTDTALEITQQAALALDELERLSISNLGIDTDGTPYFSIGNTAAHMHQDVDGTPYFTPA